jgi:hypothetical protein
MKIKSILFLLLLAIPVFAVSQKNGYIGYRHKGVVYGATLPNGVKDLGGGLLSNEISELRVIQKAETTCSGSKKF